MAQDAHYYMSIKSPRDFRRELLGCNKYTIQLLQHYDVLRDIRVQKIKQMHEFMSIMNEINMLSSKLKRALPKAKTSSMPKDVSQSSTPASRTAPNHDVGALQKELDEIEKKLSYLDKA